MKMHNPPHPGEMIEGILEDLGLGIREFARALNVSPSTVQRLVACRAAISPEMAVKLAAVLGSTPAMWLRLQAAYDLGKAEENVDVSNLTKLYKPDPISLHS
ncbi:HigA family addiction module antitoxin [Yersinia enterocolitica]|uniref:HigA family addiction module antitoxin n=1 Tax=Yersinia enterocolitica TaxID=630 RepID=UPI003F434716